jgi:hypothetical protein
MGSACGLRIDETRTEASSVSKSELTLGEAPFTFFCLEVEHCDLDREGCSKQGTPLKRLTENVADAFAPG